jgi:hypothetical protein
MSAPWVVDGALNSARFRAYVKRALAATLRPGDVVVLDFCGRTRSRACARSSSRLPWY